MNQKKNKKLIILAIILVIILIIICGVAYAYLATDLFKSNKEKFLKYTSQIVDEKNGFIDTKIIDYFGKKQETSSENEGKLEVYGTDSSGSQQDYANISFSGKTDTANLNIEQNLKLNYSDEVNFPIVYKQVGNLSGVQMDKITSKYITVKNDDMQDSLSKIMGTSSMMDFSGIETAQQAVGSDKTFSDENKQILNKYINVIVNQLQDSNFSKDGNGYKLSLTVSDLKNIYIKLLETLQNDQTVLDKINEYATANNMKRITASTISTYINNANQISEENNAIIEMTVYESKLLLSKIKLNVKSDSGNVDINIEKNKSGNDIQYKISAQINDSENNTNTIELMAKYTGLQMMQSVTENYEVSFDVNNSSNNIILNNTVNFVDNVNIESMNSDNSFILNDYTNESVSAFMKQVSQKISDVNQQLTAQAGGNKNPYIQYLVAIMSGDYSVLPSVSLYSASVDTLDSSSASLSEMEVSAFNQKFEKYQDTNSQGATVKGLLSTIQVNNENNSNDIERQIQEINFGGTEYETTDQNITLIKSEIVTADEYKVEFEKDSNTGRIYRVVINKK